MLRFNMPQTLQSSKLINLTSEVPTNKNSKQICFKYEPHKDRHGELCSPTLAGMNEFYEKI